MSDHFYPCIWLKGNIKPIAEFYCSIFEGARILSENPFVITLKILDQKLMLMNGAEHCHPNESFSLVITCKDQHEIDYYWAKLSLNGEEGKCGWLKDQYGVSWQVVPSILGELMKNQDKAPKALYALMQMRKIDLKKLITD